MSVTKPEVKFTEVIHIQQVYEDVSDSVNPELKNTGDYKWYPQPAIRHTYGITTSPSSSVHKVFIKSETQTHLTHQPSGRGEEEKAIIRLISQSAKTQSKINLHWLSHSVSKDRLHICHHLKFRD